MDVKQNFRLDRTRNNMYKRVYSLKGDFKKNERYIKDNDGKLIRYNRVRNI